MRAYGRTLPVLASVTLVPLLAALFFAAPISAQGTLFVEGDKVGIGTGTPQKTLHLLLDGSDPSAVRIEQPGPSRIEFRDTTSGVSWDFRTTSGDTFVITKVGTGTNELKVNSLGDLVIAGSLLANDGANVFPDFVFEPSYELLSLEELSAFIEQEGHLPGVMSAKDVQETGNINMTELQLQLLEKVEELTLYVLAQQKEIEALRAQIQGPASAEPTSETEEP